jgi:D-lactate dehydrogenase
MRLSIGPRLTRSKDPFQLFVAGRPGGRKDSRTAIKDMRGKVSASLLRATRGGELPVVCDASSCTEGLKAILNETSGAAIRVIDAVAFVEDQGLPRRPPRERVTSLTLHPTCSSTRLGINESLLRLAAATAEAMVVPDDWGCCAFAGDRGMLHPS